MGVTGILGSKKKSIKFNETYTILWLSAVSKQ